MYVSYIFFAASLYLIVCALPAKSSKQSWYERQHKQDTNTQNYWRNCDLASRGEKTSGRIAQAQRDQREIEKQLRDRGRNYSSASAINSSARSRIPSTLEHGHRSAQRTQARNENRLHQTYAQINEHQRQGRLQTTVNGGFSSNDLHRTIQGPLSGESTSKQGTSRRIKWMH